MLYEKLLSSEVASRLKCVPSGGGYLRFFVRFLSEMGGGAALRTLTSSGTGGGG